MIEIKNVTKKFNKGKNKIYAVNNTSLKLPKEGLVALLGPSGCGKTTLLNLIGGLDKVNKGNIYVDGKKITSKFNFKKDKIRNNSIGYIFQDYKLVNNMSVYENVELVLKMIGVKKKSEREKRILFVLDKVGMLRYKRRPCYMLSGGERQRVAIARALVKNPDIILADEPTGNLDSKNSLEIMKIISSIAKDRLVILVTHEKSLANFYATRIINVIDGKIVTDELNKDIDDLDYIIENRIYLKDFNDNSVIKKENVNINVYKNKTDDISFDLIIKNGNIYIQSNNKVEVVDENSNVEIINDKYKKITKEELLKYNFNMNEVISDNNKKYSSIFNIFTLFINGIKKVLKYSLVKKLLLIGFFVSAMFVTFSISSYLGIRKINDSDFIKYDSNYLLANAKISKDEYNNILSNDNVNLILPTQSTKNTFLKLNTYYQVNNLLFLYSSISTLDMIDNQELYLGNYPTNNNEIVLDKLLVNKLLKEDEIKMSGILNESDFIDKKIVINNAYVNDIEYTITGIYDGNNTSIYFNENTLTNYLMYDSGLELKLLSYEEFESDINLVEGYFPTYDDEIIIHKSNKENNKIYSEIEIDSKKYKVVGYFDNNKYLNNYFANEVTVLDYLFNKNTEVAIHADDKVSTTNYLQELNINAKDSYEISKNEYIEDRQEIVNIISLIAIITLVISLVQIFIIMRSSFLSRIKEVGIYRAIGVKKSDIYKMFIGEILVISIGVSMTGVVTMSYIISNIKFLENFAVIDSTVLIITTIIIFVVNITVGLLPVFNTICKTPAYILARNDVD